MRKRPKPPNPFPPYLLPSATPALAPAPVLEPHWWWTPLFFTPLVGLMVYVDFTAAEVPVDNALALGYLVPLAMVGCSWLPVRTRAGSSLRTTLGALACVFAYFYSKLLFMVWIGAFVVAVFTGNGPS